MIEEFHKKEFVANRIFLLSRLLLAQFYMYANKFSCLNQVHVNTSVNQKQLIILIIFIHSVCN